MSEPELEVLLHTVPAAAKLLSVSRKTVERLFVKKQLPYVRIGRLVRVRDADLKEYVRCLSSPQTAAAVRSASRERAERELEILLSKPARPRLVRSGRHAQSDPSRD